MNRSRGGFTLVELIIVITLIGIVGVMVSGAISNQMYGYVEMNRRAELVQLADLAIKKMARDIRRAVPNSIRVNGTNTNIEMVPIQYAARYRAEVSDDAGSDPLDFDASDTSFDVFADLVSGNTTLSSGQVVIYNLGLESGGNPVLGANLYAANPSGDPHVISATGVTLVNNGNQDQIQLDSAHQFSFPSPRQRMYIVTGALSYICNTGAGNITRYEGYSISASQPSSPGGTSALLLNNVSSCSFTYQPGTLTRNGVVTIQLVLSDGDQSIRLLEQVHVSNAP